MLREKTCESSCTLVQTLIPCPEDNSFASLDENLNLDYIEGPFGDLEVKLVGGQTLQVVGDKVRIQSEVSTTMGKVRGLASSWKMMLKIS